MATKKQATIVEGLKIVRPYKRKPANLKSFEGSLYNEGHVFVPNTVRKFFPKADRNGYVRTGLDPDAIRIRLMADPKVKKDEMDRLSTLRDYYSSLLNEDLTPNSSFYQELKEKGFSLEDGDNIFNMEDAEQAVNYYWLMETGMIAPTLEALESGQFDPSIVKYYVHDEEVDSKIKFDRKRKTNDARVKLDTMGPIERARVAKLIGLGVSFNTTNEEVYNILDDYLSKSASQLGMDPIDNFTKICSMSSELIEVKSFVIDLERANIIRVKGSIIMEGNQPWAKTREEFEQLLLDKNQKEVYDAFKDKLKNKKSIDII